MSAQTLQQQLQGAFPTFDVSTLGDASFTTLFSNYNLATSMTLSGTSSDWALDATTGIVTYSGSLTTNLLGLTAPTAFIQFSPVGGDPDADSFILLIDLQLPSTWVFGNSFTVLQNTSFDQLTLAASPDSALVLASAASTDPQRSVSGASYNAPAGLSFVGAIDGVQSQVLKLLSVLTGAQSASLPANGLITMQLAGSGGGNDLPLFNIPLFDFTVNDIAGTELSLDATIGLLAQVNASAGNAYQAGLGFTFTMDYEDSGSVSTSISLEALYADATDAVLDITLTAALGFPSTTTMGQLLGSDTSVMGDSFTGMPDSPFTSSNLPSVTGISFGVITSPSLSLSYAGFSLGTTLSSPWKIWPGIIEVSAVSFSFEVTGPFSAIPDYDFILMTSITIGNIPLNITGEYQTAGETGSSLTFGGNIQIEEGDPAPSVSGFLQAMFGAVPSGLPEDLVISKFSFDADVTAEQYSVEIDITGNWMIEFGINDQMVFEELGLSIGYEGGTGGKGLYGSLLAKFEINDQQFDVELDVSTTSAKFIGKWEAGNSGVDFVDIGIALGMYNLPNLPDGLDLKFTGMSFEFDYTNSNGPVFEFTLDTNYGDATLVAAKTTNGTWGFAFGMELDTDLSINLTNIPVVGNLLPSGDTELAITELRIVAANANLPNVTLSTAQQQILGTAINSGLVISVTAQLGSDTETYTAKFGGTNDGTAADAPPTPPPTPPTTGTTVPPSGALPAGTVDGGLVTWMTIQRTFGPLQINRVGYEVTSDTSGNSLLGLLLDAAVSLSGLTITLDSLEATIPLAWPPNFNGIDFSLGGLQIAFSSGSFTIAGGLMVNQQEPQPYYEGDLTVQFGSFGATAFGSYTKTQTGAPAFLAYLLIDFPIGGPGFFFITGLAGAFGYNSSVTLPTNITQVPSFLLVSAAMGKTSATDFLAQIPNLATPMDNEYWAAAGVRFTSYGMLDSFAMIEVSFGAQFGLALLGQSTLTVPANPAAGDQTPTIAIATLAIEVTFEPAQGVLSVQAQLVNPSWVFSTSSVLTGGFAFFLWFGSNPYAGDFVVTLGGYNPYYTPPSYYPSVPRLGFSWQLSTEMSIKGGLYFAITPSVVMAGGSLNAVWQSGNLKAWFSAEADFLIRYKPFFFSVYINVTIGASATIHFVITKTITISVGVSLNLWGPQFGGSAKVDLSILSFTFSFGSSPPSNAPIDWGTFLGSFLPSAVPDGSGGSGGSGNAMTAADTTSGQSGVIAVSAPVGLLSTLSDGSWQVNPGALTITANLQIPGTVLSEVNSASDVTATWTTQLGIGPLGYAAGTLSSVITVTVDFDSVTDTTNTWTIAPILGSVTNGVWVNTSNTMQTNGTTANALVGMTIIPIPQTPDVTAEVPLVLLLLSSDAPDRYFSWSSVVAPTTDSYDQSQSIAQITGTINTTAVQTRDNILQSLINQGLSVPTDPALPLFAAEAGDLLTAPPQLRLLGETPLAV